jgi:protein arginine kinase activator
MKCEKCQKKNASIHLTEIFKDMKSEVHLCEACAREIGLNAKVTGFTVSLKEVISYINAEEEKRVGSDVSEGCMICGTTVQQYAEKGLLGCPDCYRYLWKEIGYNNPHDHSTDYRGIVPENRRDFVEEVSVTTLDDNTNHPMDLDSLSFELNRAVEEERYEDAARLRDEIASYPGGES